MNTIIKHISKNSLSIRKYSTSLEKHYDIVISGGGMVGFSAAAALSQSERLEDKRILLIERQPNTQWNLPEEYSNRVSSLNNKSKNFLSKLSVWPEIEAIRAHPVRKMQVWDACSESFITFDQYEEGGDVAHIVENSVASECLKNHIQSNTVISYNTKVSSYDLPKNIGSKVKIHLENGDDIETDLLIGADGATSLVRQSMGAKYISWDYDNAAIVATLVLSEETENNVAWQKFLPTGPIALLPLSNTRTSLVWSTTKKEAKRLLELSEIEFVDALNNSLWHLEENNEIIKTIHDKWKGFLDTIIQSSSVYKQLPPSIYSLVPQSRASFPLGLGHSVHYVAPRVALIGDAAHKVHPLAGQGVNLGYGDVEELLYQLENAAMLGADIGNLSNLYKYESNRQKHNMATMAGIDGLYRLYSTNCFPVVLARSLGLSAVDHITPLKKEIMKHAGT